MISPQMSKKLLYVYNILKNDAADKGVRRGMNGRRETSVLLCK